MHAQEHTLLLRNLSLRRKLDEDYDEPEKGASKDFKPDASHEQATLLRLCLPVLDHLRLGHFVFDLDGQ